MLWPCSSATTWPSFNTFTASSRRLSWMQTGAQQLIHLGELRTQLQRAAEGLDGVVELAGLHQQLAQAEVAQLVVGIVTGHLAKLGDALR